MPGGGIKCDESAEAAIAREVREEVGIEINNIKLVDTILLTHEYKRDTVHIFRATAINTSLTLERAEIATAFWCPLSDLPQNISPELRKHLIAS